MLLGEFVLNTPLTHSQKLMPMVESLLGMLDLKVRDFDLMIACEGPGSFTGVRIGLSTVKAFAQPFGIPVVTETSLSLLAGAFPRFEGIILSMLDAKRNEVYYGVMRWEGNKLVKLEEDVEEISLLLDRVTKAYPEESIVLVGDALEVYESTIEPFIKFPNLKLASGVQNVPRASQFSYLIESESTRLGYLDVKANYMRKSQAERDLKRKDA